MKQKEIIFTAKVLSVVFTPFYLPILGLMILFIFSYLSLLPLTYKLFLLLMFYLFTVLLPTALIRFYRRYQGWTPIELGSRERRVIPYIISIFSYLVCYYIMTITHVPHFMGSILIAALVIQIACAMINLLSRYQPIRQPSAALPVRCWPFRLSLRSIRCGGSASRCCLPEWLERAE